MRTGPWVRRVFVMGVCAALVLMMEGSIGGPASATTHTDTTSSEGPFTVEITGGPVSLTVDSTGKSCNTGNSFAERTSLSGPLTITTTGGGGIAYVQVGSAPPLGFESSFESPPLPSTVTIPVTGGSYTDGEDDGSGRHFTCYDGYHYEGGQPDTSSPGLDIFVISPNNDVVAISFPLTNVD